MLEYFQKPINVYKSHKQSIKYAILIFFAWWFTKPKFDEILKHDLVDNSILSHIVPSYNYDILLISVFVVSIGSIIYTIYNGAKYGGKRQIWILLLSAIYFNYRVLEGNLWHFVPFKFSFLDYLKLLDILLLPLLIVCVNDVIVTIKNKLRITKFQSFGFDTDEPIVLQHDEKSGRFKFVLDLKDRIEATNNSQSAFAIAINGQWGSGKTSFMKTLDIELSKNKNTITFFYSPWRVRDHRKIVESFFTELNLALLKFDKSIENDIDIYLKALLEDAQYPGGVVLKHFIGGPTENKSVNSQHDKLNEIISGIQRKIVVFVDDIDRLDKAEVVEVLKLIRNTADFGNIVFVAAFDRNYVVSAIDNTSSHHREFYLEKIFQFEFALPILPKNLIVDLLHAKLLRTLEGRRALEDMQQFKKMQAEGIGIASTSNGFERLLTTVRDVYRYLNLFYVYYPRIEGEVYFPDFYNLLFIRLKYPSVYDILYRNQAAVFKKPSFMKYSSSKYVELALVGNIIPGHQYAFKVEDTILFSLLSEFPEAFSISKKNITEIVTLISLLFPQNTQPGLAIDKSHLSINQIKAFERYFIDVSILDVLSEVEFNEGRKAGGEEFKQKLNEWNGSRNISLDVINRFKLIDDFNDLRDFETVIEGIIYHSNLPIKNSSWGSGCNMYSGGFEDFAYKLGLLTKEYGDKRIKKYYSGDSKKYIAFVKKIFMASKEVGDFFDEFANYLVLNNCVEVLDYVTLKQILLNKFDVVIKTETHLSNELFRLFETIVRLPYINSNFEGTLEIKEEIEHVNELFKNFILNIDLDGFIQYNILRTRRDAGCYISAWIRIIFDSDEAFISRLETLNSLYKREYTDFFVALKNANAQRSRESWLPINFDFKTIPLL